jgi:hypothetical protein
MPFANSAGLGVNNYYGPRDAGGAVGIEHGENSLWIMSVQITPDFYNGTYVPPFVVPKGAQFKRAVLRVDEAFNITGTTPVLVIGATGTETTNGIVISEAELETIGTKTPASTGTGTWAQSSTTGTTAAAKVGKALTGTTPVAVVGTGKATLVLEFFNKTKV